MHLRIKSKYKNCCTVDEAQFEFGRLSWLRSESNQPIRRVKYLEELV